MVRISLITVLVLALAGCSTFYRNHGYVPTTEDLAEVKVGRDTKETVAEAIGQPSAAGVLDEGAWYYVQSRFLLNGYKEPTEIERQVLAISFNKGGVVSNIERFSLQDGRVITLSRRVTSSSVRDTAFLNQLLGNLGQVDAGRLFGN